MASSWGSSWGTSWGESWGAADASEDNLSAVSVESASEVGSPTLAQVHALTALSVESGSEVSSPTIGQIHALTATSVESASEVSEPDLEALSEHALTAVSVEAASEVSSPTLAQVHVLVAVSVEALSEVSRPALNGAEEVEEDDRPAGGWLFHNLYEAELQRRRARDREREKLEEETEQIENAVDREIGQLLRAQEAKDDKREDFKRLAELAKANADLEAARQYSERVATAMARVLAKGNYSAIEALDRELKRAKEEEDFIVNALWMLLD